MRFLPSLVFALQLVGSHAQFGRRNSQAVPDAAGMSDVDLAMAGWEQLSKNPDKMQEIVKSFKDPDVWNKATEMLKDPVYMEAAKAKLAEIQAKAQAQGLLDASGNPVPGNADMLRMAEAMGAAAGGPSPSGVDAREFEVENMARHRAGELNTAELGLANVRQAAQDPAMMGEIAQMMANPNTMADVKKMMADPAFKAQAQAMLQKMQADGSMPDMSQVMQKAQQMAASMGGSGNLAEMARLKAENAMLKQQIGMKAEL